jgi:pimeloyl-ACP methyl ester carboxylesterase
MTTADGGFLEVGDRRIRHRIVGTGADAVVMVHGFGGSLETWAKNQAALAAAGRTVASTSWGTRWGRPCASR